MRLFTICTQVTEGSGLALWRSRLTFLAKALLVRRQLEEMLQMPGSLSRHIAQRPETLGAVVWPYISTSWDASERLTHIQDHFAALDTAVPRFDFDIEHIQVLADFGELLPGVRVILDQPKWFMREGQLCLNIFRNETRLFTLAFSLAVGPPLAAYVGAVQGRNIEGSLDTYKELTNAFHGMRPRDFLVEAFLTLCRAIGVERVFAVADANRHHRSPYFGNDVKSFSLNYDDVWRERGGVQHARDFFNLPIEGSKRNLSDVPSKKRSMYRKRYELIDQFDVAIRKGLREGFVNGHRNDFAD